jgi:hypothetical protein
MGGSGGMVKDRIFLTLQVMDDHGELGGAGGRLKGGGGYVGRVGGQALPIGLALERLGRCQGVASMPTRLPKVSSPRPPSSGCLNGSRRPQPASLNRRFSWGKRRPACPRSERACHHVSPWI